MKKVAQKNLKEKKKNRVNEERESLFVGVDVHKKNWMVSIVDEEWKLKKKTSIPGNSASLLHLINGFGNCDVKVCYEAGGFGFGLYDDLTTAGIDATVIAPSMTPKRAGDRVKTDRRDSENLATKLAKRELTEICIPDITRRAHREIIRGYDQVKKERQRVMNQIKSFLTCQSKNPPSGIKANWSRKYVTWLKEKLKFEKDVDGCLRFRLDQLIEQYEFLREQEKKVKSKIDELCELPQYEEKIEAVKENIKGVGSLTILRLLLEVGDFSRFKNSRKFTSYLGLTPSEHSSGEKDRRGSLTGYGNRSLRSALVEVSWVVLRYSNSFRHTFRTLSYRIGKNKAIVAIARKLAIRLFWIIRETEMIEQAA
jgi:transposase